MQSPFISTSIREIPAINGEVRSSTARCFTCFRCKAKSSRQDLRNQPGFKDYYVSPTGNKETNFYLPADKLANSYGFAPERLLEPTLIFLSITRP